MTYKALALASDPQFEKDLCSLDAIKLSSTKSPEQFYAQLEKDSPDIVLLSIGLRNLNCVELLNELRKHDPTVPAIFIVSDSDLNSWKSLPDRHVELIRTPINQAELQFRIERMLSTLDNQVPVRKVNLWTVAELRNDQSGRLDAKLISEVFGISLADIARIVDRPLSSIHKTPDADSLQFKLANFERIASALLRMSGSAKGLKIWLNTPNKDFGGEIPINLIKRGWRETDMITDWLEDALLGHPN